VGVCQLVQLAKQSGFVESIQFQYVVPLSNNRKLVAQVLRFQMQIMLQEKVSGALQEVGRVIYCWNLLIMKSEELFPFGRTQQFLGLDIVGTHITDSGNNLQSSILTDIKNLLQVLHCHLCLSASTSKVLCHWLLPLST
jgi:hypothetical protein